MGAGVEKITCSTWARGLNCSSATRINSTVQETTSGLAACAGYAGCARRHGKCSPALGFAPSSSLRPQNRSSTNREKADATLSMGSAMRAAIVDEPRAVAVRNLALPK